MNIKRGWLIFALLSTLLTGCIGKSTAPQPTALPSPYYKMTSNSPRYLSYPGGCEGMWVAGTVTDFSGGALEFGLVRLNGSLGTEDAFAGIASQYGIGGYEIQLAASLADNHGTFLQVYDFSGDAPQIVSELAGFRTYADCNKNLVVINWEQVK